MNTQVLKNPSFAKSSYYKGALTDLLERADIRINGSRPWDIQVHDEQFYSWTFCRGSLGFGESFMKGLWDCSALDQLQYKVLSADLEQFVKKDFRALWYRLGATFLNRQTLNRSQGDIHKHYDIGNDLFEAMLDKYMNYSCGYWKNASNLDEAQEHKMDLICRKLKLNAGQKVLDIGCGWGDLARFAAENYGVEVVGITISKEQVSLARKRCRDYPVEIRYQDYRNLREKFDRVASVGMFEHVGYKNYRSYMEVVGRVLKDDGLFLLHTIGSNISVTSIDPWINTYIFPNAVLPSIAQIGKAAEHKLVMEDWHNFGTYYDLTLMEWLRRFKAAWPVLQNKYGNSFYRMWIYYLSSSAACFRAKRNNLWQIVFSKPSNHHRYISVR